MITLTTPYLPVYVMNLKLEEPSGAIAYDSIGTHDGILEG